MFSHYIILIAISIICFGVSFNGDLVFDDSEAILRNKDVLPSSNFVEIFQHDFWGSNMSSKGSHKSYRPLTVLTYRLSFK